MNTKEERTIKIIVAGVGGRGAIYASYFNKVDGINIVGLAEPRHEYRHPIEQECEVPNDNLFDDWRDMAQRDKFADLVVIATQDRMHVEPVIAFAEKGYHILLEKPMAPDIEGCQAIFDAVKRNQVNLVVCHILRYTDYTQKIKEITDSGVIGEIVSIEHLEPVRFWHQAHSFVRGNWGNSTDSSSMLLAKSCHDIDWIRYIMNKQCQKVSSFGSLFHFRKEEQPEGAAERCLNCPENIEKTCPYSAKRFYFRRLNTKDLGWPLNVLNATPTRESITEALKNGPYGRCVYSCDNDVVDHQVVNMEFEEGRTASFTMTAFTAEGGRKTKIFGTQGEIVGDSSTIKVHNFLTGKCEVIDTKASSDDIQGGHGGGDWRIVESVATALKDGSSEQILTGPEVSLESHLMVFAAEKSRLEKRIVKMSELIQ